MGYTYVSGMCRVCIGYVSGMCRKKRDARDEINDNGDNWRGNQHPAALRGRCISTIITTVPANNNYNTRRRYSP